MTAPRTTALARRSAGGASNGDPSSKTMSARLPGAILAEGTSHSARGREVAERSTAAIGTPASRKWNISSISATP